MYSTNTDYIRQNKAVRQLNDTLLVKFMWTPSSQILGPIGLVISTFIGFKFQTCMYYVVCTSLFNVCLGVCNKRQNGWTDGANILYGTSHDPREGLWMIKFSKIEFWWRQIFENLIIHKPFLGSRKIPQKIWAQSVQPFRRLLNTNKQTDQQSKYINYYYCSWRDLEQSESMLLQFSPILDVQ